MCQDGATFAWRTSLKSIHERHLAQVPRVETDDETLGDQLAEALERTGVSQRELGRRLARNDAGTKSESKRRWLGKILNDEVEPEDASLAEIEAALGESVFRNVERARVARRRRLQSLEAMVDDLAFSVLALLRMATALTAQVQALGGSVPQDIQQELAQAALRMQLGAQR